jgi:hypothetical protein
MTRPENCLCFLNRWLPLGFACFKLWFLQKITINAFIALLNWLFFVLEGGLRHVGFFIKKKEIISNAA